MSCSYSLEETLLGETVYIRTVNYAVVGTVVGVDARNIWLHPAADVIQTGAFRQFFSGTLVNYGVLPTTLEKPEVVSRAAYTRISRWPHKVPTTGGD